MVSLSVRIRRQLKSGFFADVAKLSVGTLAGRLITFAVMPILTRIYTPSDFAVLATYLAILSTVTVAACLRLEVAVPMADTEEQAVNLLALALSALSLVTATVLILVLVMPDIIGHWLGNVGIEPYLLLVPFGIAMAGSYSAFQYWTTRARRFGHIARTRVSQSFLGAATMVSLGWWGLAPFGLLLGNAVSIGAGGLGLAFGAIRKEGAILRQVSLSGMRDALRRYRRYPLFSTPEALLNIAGVQVPVLIIAAKAGPEAGHLLLGMQLMAAPMALLGSSISQVYVARAPQAFREGRLYPFTKAIMKRLALTGIPPLLAVAILAPLLVPYVFGEQWTRSGVIIAWMAPWIAMQLIASPVSMVMMVTDRQAQLLLVRIVTLALRVGVVVLSITMMNSGYLVELFAITNALVYAIMAWLFINAARSSPGLEEKTVET